MTNQTAHASVLAARHAGLEARIEAETRRPAPDQFAIANLKKRKLKIKEELISS